jgi:hypothetical protein
MVWYNVATIQYVTIAPTTVDSVNKEPASSCNIMSILFG